jgi:UDP-N-acetyl-D-mannosaminuronate dehydrogenase
VENLDQLLEETQAVILITGHRDFEGIEDRLKENNIKAVVDGMNFLNGEKIKKSGVLYHGIGRY